MTTGPSARGITAPLGMALTPEMGRSAGTSDAVALVGATD